MEVSPSVRHGVGRYGAFDPIFEGNQYNVSVINGIVSKR
jgi:hypothetical protein